MMNTFLKSTAKVFLAGATIAMIGGAMLVVSDTGAPEVKPVQADIASLAFGGETNTESFVESLDALGMEEPRPYDWNGNKVFFSTDVTDESPEQVLVRFQKQFVRSGINKRPYFESLDNLKDGLDPSRLKKLPPKEADASRERIAEHWERDSAFFSGGIVPVTISDKYVAMAGTVTKGKATDGFDFIKEMKEKGKRPLTDHVGGMRYIEATRMGQGTRINAVYTDEDIEFSKFHASKKSSNVSMSAKVPSCMGCTRLMRFAGESKDEQGYVMSIYEGTLSVPQTIDFYEESMKNRGWRLAPTTNMLRRLEEEGIKPKTEGEVLSFAKGDEFVTVLVHPASGKTSVQIMESP